MEKNEVIFQKQILFKIFFLVSVFKVCFIFSWTPYAVVSFYAAFLGNDLPPLAGTLPAMFAKSEFLWSSLVFIWSNRLCRMKLRELFFCSNQQTNEYKRIIQGNFFKSNEFCFYGSWRHC